MSNENAMHIPKMVRRLFPKLSAECDALEARERVLKQRLATLSEQLQVVDAQNQALNAQNQSLDDESNDLKSEIVALRELEGKSKQVEAQNAALQESVDAADKIISEQHTLRVALEAKYVSLREEADAVSEKLETVSKTLSDVTHERDAMIHAVQISDAKYDELVARWDAYRLPSIIISTMPKSGTYYISNHLSKGLHCKTRIISNQYFPYDAIRYSEIKEASLGSYITQDHFPASPTNTHFISQLFDRAVCHLRDPRQAMLSYIHYLEGFKGGDDTFALIYPRLPDDFFELPIESRLDWGVDNWLPLLVEWTAQWVEFAEGQDKVTVKFTRFEDLVSDEEAFTQDILDFYGIPQPRFIPPVLKKDGDVHFRSGLIDEWRSALTPDQQERATAQIPLQIAKRFGWSLDL